MAIPLKCFNISEELFDKILSDMSTRVVFVDNIDTYSCGYKNKKTIYCDNEYLICQEYLFAYFADIGDEDVSDWKQVKLRKTEKLTGSNNNWQATIDGPRAYNYMMKLLHKYYTDEELAIRFSMFESDYCYELKQLHYEYPSAPDEILEHENCIKYDINGAHQDALIEIFPRAKDDLLEIYKQRKIKPVYKDYMNFFVGMFCKRDHRRTYNWIIQRTTTKMLEAINYCDGDLVYANTDGFIIKNYKNKLNTSKELGDFKLEYTGTVYTHKDYNYWCYELENPEEEKDRIKGSVRYQVRHLISLKNGTIPRYNITKTYIGTDEAGKRINGPDELTNIRLESINVYKES